MNNIIKIGDKDYPFHFGMRTLFDYASMGAGEDLEFHEIEIDGYGDFMDIFTCAHNAAIDRGSKGKRLDPIELEDLINSDPKAFKSIMDAFENSKFKKAMEEADMTEESGNEKKPKN